MSSLTWDDLRWNWSRWVWSGTPVGNMEPYVCWGDDHRPINYEHAKAIGAM